MAEDSPAQRPMEEGGDPSTLEGAVDPPSTDLAFELMAADRRRRVVAHLLDREGATPVEDLASAVAAGERDVDGSAVPERLRERVHASLRHCHLPKLARAGVVTFDGEAGTVAPTGTTSSLVPFLDAAGAVTGADRSG